MKRFTLWLVSRLTPAGSDPLNDPDVRTRIGLIEGWTAVAVNTALAALKAVLGFYTGSVSLLGDAANNLSDLLISGIVILGFRISRKPPDEEHPFGHGRMESVAGIVIGVLFAVVAFEVFKASLDRIIHPRWIHAENWLIWTLVGTMAVKEVLSRFARSLGDMIHSATLRADAWNHRADVFATGMVVIAFIGAHWEIGWLDGVMGMGVSAFIAWTAYKTVLGAVDPLLGQNAPEEMYEEIERIARAVPGVLGVHDVLVHRYGSLSIVSLHIEVPALETATKLHHMCDEIEMRIGKRYTGHAIVHADPLNTDHTDYQEVSRIVGEALSIEPAVSSFHDLRLFGDGRTLKVVLDIAVKPGAEIPSKVALCARLRKRLREKFPYARAVIDVEPPYFRNVAPSDPGKQEAGRP